MTAPTDPPAHHLRIGQLAERVGASTTLLRAWERRYGLLEPVRTERGYRLYSADDEARVRSMLALIADGISARQAAGMVLSGTADLRRSDGHEATLAEDLARFGAALGRFDDLEANAVFDALLARYTVGTVLSAVVVPYLGDLGDRWARGEATVAQEHFASNVIRGRLLGLARGWDAGGGPRAVLACPSGERHDLGLLAFGIALRGRGWRITYLGADTPWESLRESVSALAPAAVVLAMTVDTDARAVGDGIGDATRMVAIGGRAASPALAERLGAELLDCDPVAAAARVAGRPR